MSKSVVEKRVRLHRDDPPPPCGCFVSNWNTPEEYDEDLAPVQCFPQAFPFTLFQARAIKASQYKATTHDITTRGMTDRLM
jgi:hypothetical protein